MFSRRSAWTTLRDDVSVSDHCAPANAVELVGRALTTEMRVLVTGGSGWIGRTALCLLWQAFGPDWVHSNVAATGSRPRRIEVLGCGEVDVLACDRAAVERFAPTVIVNCAFPTRDRVATMGQSNYLGAGGRLLDAFSQIFDAPGVERVISFSSGAAVPSAKFPADVDANPYGVLKAQEEDVVRRKGSEHGLAAVTARVWAVSGPHVQHPEMYALSGFVLQALRTGTIRVRSSSPVVRSYCSAGDVVAVALAQTGEHSTLFDTGGAAVEVGGLAQIVAEMTGATVDRPVFDPAASPDDYRGDERGWNELCADHSLQPLDLEEQVRAVIWGMRSWR